MLELPPVDSPQAAVKAAPKDSSAFDIAQVFVGAIVGAAGATVKKKF